MPVMPSMQQASEARQPGQPAARALTTALAEAHYPLLAPFRARASAKLLTAYQGILWLRPAPCAALVYDAPKSVPMPLGSARATPDLDCGHRSAGRRMSCE